MTAILVQGHKCHISSIRTSKSVKNVNYHYCRCWSFVGDLKTGQNVSIGERCDTKAIIEHELLHALGFYHEQSRSDRDDYVKIWWDQIIPGYLHKFHLTNILLLFTANAK